MACGRTVGKFRFRVVAGSAADTWEPIGQPLVIVGGHVLDYALTVSTLTGGITVAPATALMVAREDQVDAIDVAGGPRATAPGTTHHVTDLTKVGNRFLAQPGVAASRGPVGDDGYATGTLSIILQSCGALVGTRAVEVNPNQTYERPQIYPIGRVPAAGAESLRAAIVYNSVNDLQHRCSIAANRRNGRRRPFGRGGRIPQLGLAPNRHRITLSEWSGRRWRLVVREQPAHSRESPHAVMVHIARGGRVPGRQDRRSCPGRDHPVRDQPRQGGLRHPSRPVERRQDQDPGHRFRVDQPVRRQVQSGAGRFCRGILYHRRPRCHAAPRARSLLCDRRVPPTLARRRSNGECVTPDNAARSDHTDFIRSRPRMGRGLR